MTTKRGRQLLKERWRLRQKGRARIEAELAQGKITLKELEAQSKELGLHAVKLPSDLLKLIKFPPDLDFIVERLKLNKIPLKGTDVWGQIIIDLMASDIPLSPGTRSLIAGELRRFYIPGSVRKQHLEKRQTEVWAFEQQKRILLSRGMTKGEAESEIAKGYGIGLGTLRKKIQRARKK